MRRKGNGEGMRTSNDLLILKETLEATFEDKEQLRRFKEASKHSYYCKCDLCLEWWELMGPEE